MDNDYPANEVGASLEQVDEQFSIKKVPVPSEICLQKQIN